MGVSEHTERTTMNTMNTAPAAAAGAAGAAAAGKLGDSGGDSCPINPCCALPPVSEDPYESACSGGACNTPTGRSNVAVDNECKCCLEEHSGVSWGGTSCSATSPTASTPTVNNAVHHRFGEQASEDLLDLLQTESRAHAKVEDFTCW